MPNNDVNPFDDAAASVMQQDAQNAAVQIRNNVQFASTQSPDQAAQVILGHSKPDTTINYAGQDMARAKAVMAEIG